MNKKLLISLVMAGLAGNASDALAQAVSTLPYIADLTQSAEGWTSFNYNTDSEYWMYFDGMGPGMASNFNDADDAYVSPAITLEAGKTYEIAASVQLFSDFNENYKLSLTAGRNMDKDELKPMKQFSFVQQGVNTDSYTFTPEESGTYYFGFLNNTTASVSNGAVIINAFGIQEKEEEAEDDGNVYSEDFSDASHISDWTIADANGDGTTWADIDGLPGITYNSDAKGTKSPADDWLFSPEFSVKENQDYLISYSFLRQGAFDDDVIDVCLGKTADAAAMTNVLKTEKVGVNAETVTYTLRVTSDATGKARLGFHITTPSAENGQISLTAVSVQKEEKSTPTAVEDFSAASSHKDKTVTLSWKNPSFDTKGIGISQPISVKLYENDKLITTVGDQEAGKEGSYVYSPEVFEGYATYKAVAAIGDNESEGVQKTINLDDLQGELVVLKAFDVDYDTAGDWKIDGDNKAWKHDYQNVFTYNYRVGSRYNSEWLISPTADMTADRRYVLTYELKTSRDYANNLEVTIGNAQDAAAQTKTVAGYYDLKLNGFELQQTDQFTIDADGKYAVGFHVLNNGYYVNMRNLKICYIKPEGDTDGITDIATADNAAEVKVYDTAGRLVRQTAGASVSETLATMGSGLYVVKTTGNDGKTHSVKVLK